MQKVYAVRDVKADAYSALQPLPNDAIAKRSFMEVALDPRSELAKYPEDYSLYCLGSFDPVSGKLEGETVPRYICSAFEVVNAARKAVAAKVVEAEVAK